MEHTTEVSHDYLDMCVPSEGVSIPGISDEPPTHMLCERSNFREVSSLSPFQNHNSRVRTRFLKRQPSFCNHFGSHQDEVCRVVLNDSQTNRTTRRAAHFLAAFINGSYIHRAHYSSTRGHQSRLGPTIRAFPPVPTLVALHSLTLFSG